MQQALWTYTNSYDRRFGPEFFKQVPEKPGVFWMQDSRRSLLYVGRSRNLRNRLLSYRYLQTQHGPKKLGSLIEEVRSLGWSPTETDEAARLLESQILHRHPPLYRAPESSSEKAVYLSWSAEYPYFQLQLLSQRNNSSHRILFGLFKSRAQAQKAISCMSRLLWWLGHQGQFFNLPSPLAKNLGPQGHQIDMHLDRKSFELLNQLVQDYFRGEHAQIIDLFQDSLLAWCKENPASFFSNWVQSDLGSLKQFFSLGPRKNNKLRQLFQLPHDQIEMEWVDELIRLS